MSATLAIVTSTPEVSVALSGPDGPIASLALRAGRRHGETLAPAIRSLTELAGVPLSSVDLVAVDTGPGLFTGLRVGVATAKALASALAVPVAPCSSLDLLAHPHRALGRPVVSIVDARRGEVFWARYEPVDGGMAAVTDPAVATPDDLAVVMSDDVGVLLAGDGARRYFAGRTFDVAGPEFDHPSAAVLAGLARRGPSLPADKVTPTYLRGADVRIGWEVRS